jgi:hypothetical protein
MTKSKTLLILSGVLALTLGLSRSALAQTDANAAPPAAAASSSSSSSAGGGGAGIGVGASQWLSGITGADIVYDASAFHVGGTIGFSSYGPAGMMGGNRTTNIIVGVNGWYHLHHGASSDFSAGGGLGFADASAGGNSVQAFVIEPGVMARFFATSNVALHARVGLTMAFGDNGTQAGGVSGIALSGQVNGAIGFTYFFR